MTQLNDHPAASIARASRALTLTPGQDLAGYILSLAGRMVVLTITSTSILSILLIFYFVIRESLPFLSEWGAGELIVGREWYPTARPASFGGLPLIVGSLYVTGIAILIAGPLGILAAALLSDIVSFRVRQWAKPIIELLAAIPSVAYGFFAILLVAPWLQETLGMDSGRNALNAGVMLAIMALPTIVSISEDSLTAVGRELREASYGLGATRAETVLKVVIPAGRGGIIAAVILGIMRAIGETMVVWMAAGNAAAIPSPWYDLSSSVRTMTATIAAEMGETPRHTDHYYALFAIGALLLGFTFVLNMVSDYFLGRSRRTGRAKVGK